jgi:hypothetical protein
VAKVADDINTRIRQILLAVFGGNGTSTDPESTSGMLTPAEMEEQGRKLLELRQSLVSGQLKLLDLQLIKERFGDGWSRKIEQVHAICETVLKRHLARDPDKISGARGIQPPDRDRDQSRRDLSAGRGVDKTLYRCDGDVAGGRPRGADRPTVRQLARHSCRRCPVPCARGTDISGDPFGESGAEPAERRVAAPDPGGSRA